MILQLVRRRVGNPVREPMRRFCVLERVEQLPADLRDVPRCVPPPTNASDQDQHASDDVGGDVHYAVT